MTEEATTISGVLIKPGVESVGSSGTAKVYSKKSIANAAESATGTVIYRSASPGGNTVVGEVTKAMYEEGEGLVFEGEIVDDYIAEMIDSGLVDIAPRTIEESVDVVDLSDDSPVRPALVSIDSAFCSICPTDAVGETSIVRTQPLSEFLYS